MSTQMLSRRRRVLRQAVRVADAATAPHGIDRYLELAWPAWSSTEVRARVVQVRRAAPGTVTLTLRPNGNWTGFRAGQHTQVTVEIDGVRHTRCYSLANSALAGDGLLELTVKAHPEGLVSGHLVRHAETGLVVGLSPAQGDFTLPDRPERRLLLVSGGSGITPVLSMLRTACDAGAGVPVTFVHYALTPADHPYRREVDRLAAEHPEVRVVNVYTDAPGAGDLDGVFSAEQLEQAEPAWADADAYVCGPAPLMEAVRAHYGAAGLGGRYHDEAFVLAPLTAAATGAAIDFAVSGQRVADDGRTLLEQAESAGLTPTFGCRMGICHTCTRSLVAGAVRNVVTGEITDHPGADIRICVSGPASDLTLDL